MLALTTDTAKQYGLYGIVGVLVLGVLSAIIVRKVVGKIISLIITVGLAAMLFGQRGAINDCIKNNEPMVKAGKAADVSCTFFGQTIKLPADATAGTGTGTGK